MNDMVGAHIEMGDTVIYVKTRYNGFDWKVGKVTGFTAAMVKVTGIDIDLHDKSKIETVNKKPDNLIVTNGLQAAALERLKETR